MTGCSRNATSSSSPTTSLGGRRQRRRDERGRRDLGPRPGARTRQLGPVEAERPAGHEATRGEVAGVEGLQGVAHHDPAQRRGPGAGLDRVEQLPERDGRRAGGHRCARRPPNARRRAFPWRRTGRRAGAGGPPTADRARPRADRGPARRRRRRRRRGGTRRRRCRAGRPRGAAPTASVPAWRRSACPCGSWHGWAARAAARRAARARRPARAGRPRRAVRRPAPRRRARRGPARSARRRWRWCR